MRALLCHRNESRAQSFADGLTEQDEPNAVWGIDFEGHFPLRNGRRCYPLTVSDGYSRLLLRREALTHPDELSVREA